MLDPPVAPEETPWQAGYQVQTAVGLRHPPQQLRSPLRVPLAQTSVRFPAQMLVCLRNVLKQLRIGGCFMQDRAESALQLLPLVESQLVAAGGVEDEVEEDAVIGW